MNAITIPLEILDLQDDKKNSLFSDPRPKQRATTLVHAIQNARSFRGQIEGLNGGEFIVENQPVFLIKDKISISSKQYPTFTEDSDACPFAITFHRTSSGSRFLLTFGEDALKDRPTTVNEANYTCVTGYAVLSPLEEIRPSSFPFKFVDFQITSSPEAQEQRRGLGAFFPELLERRIFPEIVDQSDRTSKLLERILTAIRKPDRLEQVNRNAQALLK